MGTSEPIKENGHAGKNGDAPSPQKTDEKNDLKTAMQKMTVGKRDLLLQDPNSAVEHLAEACEMLGKLYGETAQECGDAYFYYGKALLELGRLEAGVIDNVLDGDDSEENSEEDDDDEDEEDEAEAGEEAKDNTEADAAGPSVSGETEEEKKIDQEEIEDPSNLQLAWEMLELAKQIFGKHADSLAAESEVRMELEAKLSETYQTLGEVSIENENYPQATEDLTMCLRRRQDLLPEDSRCIAETHYQLGVALG